MAKKILVTGGNAGIGLALCQQLAEDEGNFVYLASRNQQRGEEAVKNIGKPNVKLVVMDVSNDASVAAAAAGLQGEELYAIVNNAGIGFGSETDDVWEVINTNLHGAKRVVDAFLPLLQKKGGRIANTSSGAASSYIRGQMMNKPMGTATAEEKTPLISPDVTWDQIEAVLALEKGNGFSRKPESSKPGWCAYGLSKAALTAYAMLLARENPDLVVSSCSPGFINTKLTAGFGAKLGPADGTVALKRCLFGDLGGNGYYFGSDGLRSPLHWMRDPGSPEYDGTPGAPVDAVW